MARTFLALPLAEYFSEELAQFFRAAGATRRVAPAGSIFPAVKWVLPDEIHVTLHFFGEIGVAEIQKIRDIVPPPAQNFPPLRIGLEGLGFFPDRRRPRVVWLGLAGDVEILLRLQARLEKDFSAAGFPVEDREFKPHATLGRIKSYSSPLPENFPATPLKVIDHLVLYESRGTARRAPAKIDQVPTGIGCAPIVKDNPPQSRYEILETFPLSGKTAA